MKPTSVLLLGLPLLPAITATAIPHPDPTPLQKRGYRVDTWTRPHYRYNAPQGSNTCYSSVLKTLQVYWPLPHPLRNTPILDVCDVWNNCDPRRSGDFECPTDEASIVDTLIRKSQVQEGWGAPLTREEVYRGMHLVDPETWPWGSLEEKEAGAGLAIPPMGGVEDAEPAPGPTQGGVVGGCRRWIVAREGDSCFWIAEGNGVGLGSFYEWNRGVNEGGGCNGLWVGYAYCVGV